MTITMEELVMALGLLPTIRKSTADIICPICGHKTLHFDFQRQVFACPACDTGGGIMDAWALFRGINAATKSDARKLAKQDMNKFFQVNQKQEFKYEKRDYTPVKLASLNQRDKVYKRLIQISTLNTNHKKSLIERGLNEEFIKKANIVSLPKLNQNEVKLLFDGYDLEGVPGFYRRNGRWNFVKYGSGILIPELSIEGKIQGFQIRRDKNEPKYITLSSNKEGGASCPTFTHFANYSKNNVKEILLTEGPLKADIINYFTERPVIAIPGVNSQKYLMKALEELKGEGLEKIIICFDMDYFTNPNVAKAIIKLKKLLSDMELRFVQYKWDETYKGYDDYLKSKRP